MAAWREITRFQPEVVLAFGWATSPARLALLWAWTHRRPFLLYGDNTWQHSASERSPRRRDLLVHTLCKHAAGAVVTGTFNREDFIRLGIPPWRTFDGVYPIDLLAFQPARPARKDAPATIGYAGKLTPRKDVTTLLRAFAKMQHRDAYRLRIVGDGPEREGLEILARTLGIADRTTFSGFVNQSRVAAELAAMDIVVVPSIRDMRVLIVTEAMAVGTPVVVSSSTAVWGPADLIRHGETGFVFEAGNPDSLAALLQSRLASPGSLHLVVDQAKKAVARQGPEAFARSVELAATVVAFGPDGLQQRAEGVP